MGRHLRRAILTIIWVCAFLVLTTKATPAQGLYESEWTDASAWNGSTGDIDTEVNSYIDNVSQCGGASVSSVLDGVQGSPNGHGFILQTVRPASPDVEYVWTITVGGYFPGPYGCSYYTATTTIFVKLTVTYYDTPMQSGKTCTYNDVRCASGTPTCPNRPVSTEIVLGSLCTPYAAALWVSSSTSKCNWGVVVGTYSFGACD